MAASPTPAHAGMTIMAEPIDARRCRFIADRPLDPGRWAYFPDLASADGSPLAGRLLAIEGVAAVLIAHNQITVTRPATGGVAVPVIGPALSRLRRLLGDKAGADAWPEIGKGVGAAIRDHLAAGEPAVSEAAHAAMPSPAELGGRVKAVIDEHINPVLAGHGGGVELAEVRDNVVFLRMAGGCQGCGLADSTLRHGVEAVLRDLVPEVGAVFDLTDHHAGQSPYYRPGAGQAGRSPMAGRG